MPGRIAAGSVLVETQSHLGQGWRGPGPRSLPSRQRAAAMASDPIAVSATRVVAPAPRPAPRAIQEEEPARRVAADRQPVADPDELDERHEQVADERGPSGRVCGEPAIFGNPEAGRREQA